ncbi:uncharacterized protein LOC131942052 [Physella acuta]|uniref:uncharacterized protein LOC131942052 n=1 Tax=Physella acuta TaxID=109671 RepID=UPI0027DE5276|nr:uncharacterized protein LOC131942052 [Physella acuta]
MDADYGVLTTPVSQKERRPLNRPCRWSITGGGLLALTIHYLGVKTSTCEQVLKINYTDCGLQLAVTRSFCKLEHATFKSCGEVTISSREMRVEGSMERFIISYHRYFDRALPQPPERHSCSVPSADDVTRPPGVIHRGSPEDKSVNLTKKLKLLIVYVVFGVIILVLLVALIAVIISYCRLPKSETCAKEISETTVLWRNTPLETFQTNNFLDGPILSHQTYTTKHGTQQMVSHVHSDAIYENEELDHNDAIYQNEELGHRMSNPIDMPDFLCVKKDTDFNDLLNTLQACSIYDELSNQTQELYEMPGVSYNKSQENEGSNNIYECIDRDNFRKTNIKMAAPVSGQEKHKVDGYHYSVNNDEYAIVQKYRKKLPDHISNGFQSNTLEHNSSMALGHYEKLADSKR